MRQQLQKHFPLRIGVRFRETFLERGRAPAGGGQMQKNAPPAGGRQGGNQGGGQGGGGEKR